MLAKCSNFINKLFLFSKKCIIFFFRKIHPLNYEKIFSFQVLKEMFKAKR